MAQVLLSSTPSPPPAPRERGWFASRWSRLLAIVVSIGLIAAAVRMSWVDVELSLVDSGGKYVPAAPVGARVGIFEVRPWGWFFLAFVVIASLLTLAAVLAPRTTIARAIALGAVAAAGVALAASVVAWIRAINGFERTAARLGDLAQVPTFGGGSAETYPTVTFQTEGVLWAFWAALVIALVAACTAVPSAATAIVAGAGTVLVVGMAMQPWVVVETIRPDGSDLRWVWFPSLGAHAMAGVAAACFLAVLVLFAALRRSRSGALGLMVTTVAWFLAAQVLQATVDIQPEAWMPAADRAGTVYIGIVNRVSTEFVFTIAQVLLLVAAVTAWRKVRLASRNVSS